MQSTAQYSLNAARCQPNDGFRLDEKESLTPSGPETCHHSEQLDDGQIGRRTSGGSRLTQTRGLTAIAGAMALIAVLLIVQIWLLSAALESFLAGHRRTALPAAVFSGIMFLICLFVR